MMRPKRSAWKIAALLGIAGAAVHAAGADSIKVGVVGCGGRGTGAAFDVLRAAKGVSIVALGDVFKDRVDGAQNDVRKEEGA